MTKEIEVIGKILCEICGSDCTIFQVKRTMVCGQSAVWMGIKGFLCSECLAKEDNNEET